ncbi:MAG: prefoldin subunit [Candidatus Thalassarchaeaceae archaeon]|jgi:prefoldin beta subunit|nr:prefoldin subunit [Candidatus Thalassarchaeaceae archaeon]
MEKSLENIVQELQMVSQQVATLQSQLREIQGTMEYLSSQDIERPVYQQVGPLLVEVADMQKLTDELNETNQHLSTHVETLQQRENELRTSYESAVKEFESA